VQAPPDWLRSPYAGLLRSALTAAIMQPVQAKMQYYPFGELGGEAIDVRL
jgi:hypothetical protein